MFVRFAFEHDNILLICLQLQENVKLSMKKFNEKIFLSKSRFVLFYIFCSKAVSQSSTRYSESFSNLRLYYVFTVCSFLLKRIRIYGSVSFGLNVSSFLFHSLKFSKHLERMASLVPNDVQKFREKLHKALSG